MGCVGSTEGGDKKNASAGSTSDGKSGSSASNGANGKLLEKYTLGKVLGQGAFGIVYSCKKKGTKEEYAVKMIDKVETPIGEIKQEALMLENLKHPTVVTLHDVYYEKAFVCMVMDIYRGGDMIEGMQLHWKSLGMLPISVVANVSKQMIESIAWLHYNNVVHRDVKGDNYLMDRKDIENPNCRIFLSDFGTVREIKDDARLTSKCGTKTYWAPEFFNMNYGLKVDVWAIGVVMYGLVTGRFPFKGEDDVKSKKVSIPPRSSKECGDLLKKILERKEADRYSAAQAKDHAFVANAKTAGGPANVGIVEKLDFKPEVREAGANGGIDQRRKELVERLENANAEKGSQDAMSLKDLKEKASFVVEDKAAEKKTTFEWWPESKAKETGLIEFKGATPMGSDTNGESSKQDIWTMLKDHGVKTEFWGKGEAKSVETFVEEIQTGSARIMLDATKHKTIVRVVDVVLLRIACKTKEGTKYLVKTKEQYPDGRVKENVNQLAGTKKEPHENSMQTALRIVKDRLNLKDSHLKFEFATCEYFEEEEDSPSYPGVRTVYRKEIFAGSVTTSDPKVLQTIGVTGSGKWENQDSKGYTRSYNWLNEKECGTRQVKMKAVSGNDVSALVHAPVGIGEEDLKNFLETQAIGEDGKKFDVSKFGEDGNKTLKEFSDELSKGEAALSRQPDGKIIRVVDVVVLKITKGTDVLVEVKEERGGKTKTLNWLPGVKRRPDENMFLAAHRAINKVLKVNDNFVSLNASTVLVMEEKKQSPAYCGMHTVYKKRIISAQLLMGDSAVVI
uniref:Protein kinase domain-containing protein n=1 Tax=Alexandrium andersonii TaxID=327968 RepID=A0A7S2FVZ8_9DINO